MGGGGCPSSWCPPPTHTRTLTLACSRPGSPGCWPDRRCRSGVFPSLVSERRLSACLMGCWGPQGVHWVPFTLGRPSSAWQPLVVHPRTPSLVSCPSLGFGGGRLPRPGLWAEPPLRTRPPSWFLLCPAQLSCPPGLSRASQAGPVEAWGPAGGKPEAVGGDRSQSGDACGSPWSLSPPGRALSGPQCGGRGGVLARTLSEAVPSRVAGAKAGVEIKLLGLVLCVCVFTLGWAGGWGRLAFGGWLGGLQGRGALYLGPWRLELAALPWGVGAGSSLGLDQ